MKSKRKDQLALHIEREKITKLKVYAAENHTNVSAVVRELIDRFLEEIESH